MFRLAADLRVDLPREPIDFWASMNSLVTLVEKAMQLDLFARAVFAFHFGSLTRSTVHTIMKEVFRRNTHCLREHGDEFASLAARVELASAHWLRHTAGSHKTDGALDLRHVRDNLGHESLTATSGYLHAGGKARHQ